MAGCHATIGGNSPAIEHGFLTGIQFRFVDRLFRGGLGRREHVAVAMGIRDEIVGAAEVRRVERRTLRRGEEREFIVDGVVVEGRTVRTERPTGRT